MKYLILINFVVLLDQFSKILIKNYWQANNLNAGIDNIPIIGDYLRFVFIENPGIAFGINPGKPILLTILTFVIIFFLVFYLKDLVNKKSVESWPISFILGGAIGNAIDRFLTLFPMFNYNGVIDFLDLGYSDCYYCRWYIFNFADLSISIGLIIIVYQSFFYKTTFE